MDFFSPPEMPAYQAPAPVALPPQKTAEEEKAERAVAREEAKQEAAEIAAGDEVKAAEIRERRAAVRRRGPTANLLTGSAYGDEAAIPTSRKLLMGQ